MADAGVGETAAAEAGKTGAEAATAAGTDALAAGAADATAMGGAAGLLGAADSAAADAALGLTASDVGGSAIAGDALAGGLGAGTALAGDTAMGGAAGTLGAADSSAASAALGLNAGDVAGTSGATAGLGAGGGSTFLPVTGSATADGTMALGGDMAQAFGLGDAGAGTTAVDASMGGFDPAVAGIVTPDVTLPAAADGGIDAFSSGGGLWDSITGGAGDVAKFIGQHPTGIAQTGLLGLSLLEGRKTPPLPGQANTASNAATSEVQQAEGILASGGTSSPQWATMKASIDAQVEQELNTAIAQMQQSAATNGMGGASSGVVQQQIATLQQRAIAAKEQMYSQALTSIVSQAASELSGGNQVLTQIAGMQMDADQEARQLAGEIAQYGIMLGLPGNTVPQTPGGG